MRVEPIPASFRALRVDHASEGTTRGVVDLTADDLPDGDVIVRVEYSSVNYKDALAASADGGIARISPLVPGIDLAGTVVQSHDESLPEGTPVLAHGYGLGVEQHGGFAEYARMPADWVVALPSTLSTHDAMSIGTAGFTAAMSVLALEQHGLDPGCGPVLVLGATGGVGSTAVAILAAREYEVWASTGKREEREYLLGLGAQEVLDRTETSGPSERLLDAQRWAAAVDPVGGMSLAYVLRTLNYGGAVASSGLTGGRTLETTVLPFVRRGVSILGIDSVLVPIDARRELWKRLAEQLRPPQLRSITAEIELEDLPARLDAILSSAVRGRTVVRLAGER